MEPIRVPAPPAAAFNKHRRVSDLIRAQVHHLKHLEDKMSAQTRQDLPQHGITTEEDAARYIAAMTKLLLTQPAAQAAVAPTPIDRDKRPRLSPKPDTLAIAASVETSNGKSTSSRKRKK